MQQDDFYRKILDGLYDGVYLVDPDRKITYWNKGAERITGYSAAVAVGHSCADKLLMHVDDAGTVLCETGCPVAHTLRDGLYREADVFLHHADGHRVPVSVRVVPILDESGKITGAVETFSDNSQKIAALERASTLQKLALLDPLTQTGNRRFTETELASCYDEYKRSEIPFAVIFLDIDHFKQVNDNYGHAIGDRVLKMVAATLMQNVRSYEFVGRWGGEEFLVIIKNNSVAHLKAIGERLRNLLEKSWLAFDQNVIRVTASLGATMIHPEDTVESLVQRADRLLYQGKELGRNRLVLAE